MKPVRIIIAPRGWVWVGYYEMDGDMVVLTHARNVRVWGTTEGLLQLAAEGPLPQTKLDGKGTYRIHVLSAQQLDCNPEKWTKALA